VVTRHCARGAQARAQSRLEEAHLEEQKAAGRLGELLDQLGLETGELDARVGALQQAVAQAGEREAARARARPRAEVDAELAELQETAARLRQPEWDSVTAAEATAPDVAEIEARHSEVLARLAEARGDVDTERLADRHAAVARRVAALEARGGNPDRAADATAVAEAEQQQVLYLTDDAFVAAWARQRALDGTITLLQPAPEGEKV
jgi:hypothetical protein